MPGGDATYCLLAVAAVLSCVIWGVHACQMLRQQLTTTESMVLLRAVTKALHVPTANWYYRLSDLVFCHKCRLNLQRVRQICLYSLQQYASAYACTNRAVLCSEAVIASEYDPSVTSPTPRLSAAPCLLGHVARQRTKLGQTVH